MVKEIWIDKVETIKTLLARESLRKILRSIHYLSSERIIKLVLGLVIHAWLARYLGPKGFGKLSYIVNFVSIFLPFVTFGLDDVLMKHFMEEKVPKEDLIATQVRLRFYFGLVGYTLLTIILATDSHLELKYKLMIIFYGLTLFLRIFDIIEALYQSALNIRPVFFARNTGYLSGTALKALGIFLKSHISFFVVSYFWEVLVWKFMNIRSYFKDFKWGKIDLSHQKIFLSESMPLFWGAFVVMLDSKLGNLTLKKFHGDESVGNFSIVMILVELWSFLPAAVCASLYPAIFNAKTGKSEASYTYRLQLVYDFLFWLGLFFAIGVSICADLVVQLLYGPKFPELSTLLTVSAWLGVFNFLSFGRIKFYTLENRLKTWVFLSFTSIAFNFGLQMFLVPSLHEKGALYSMLLSPFLSLLTLSLFVPFVRSELKIITKCLNAPVRILFNRN